MRLKQAASLPFVLLLFFLSGFAALLYQTIWQRLLGFFSGVDVYSVTIAVAAFMAGLGCGNLAGGYLADRLSFKRRLLVFASAEAVIALFALGSKWLYYDLLYLKWGSLGHSSFLPLIHFVSLLCPTFCMGVTLPILSKTFTSRIEVAPTVVGYFYAVNTLGAAAGALMTPWLLFRHFSFPEILRIGACLNGACAIGGALVWWLLRDHPSSVVSDSNKESDTPAIQPDESTSLSPRLWIGIYGLSGFIALSLEIVWFRLFGVLQKSTSFTFPTLLFVYLAGLGLGVMIGIALARRVRNPAIAFLALQSGVTIYAAIAFAFFIGQVDHAGFLQGIWEYLGSYDPLSAADLSKTIRAWISGSELNPAVSQDASLVFVLYFVLPGALIAPATCMMGMSFPILQRVVQRDPAFLGRRVGWLQTINIVGSMLGALLVGWYLLQWLGSAGTFKLLTILGGIFACLVPLQWAKTRSIRFGGIVVAGVIVTGIVGFLPTSQTLWARLHGTNPESIIAIEGASGLAVAKGEPARFEQDGILIFNNGLGQSWLPYGSVHTRIGLLATLIHPAPEEVAVIGLGSGDTVYAIGGSPSIRQVTCIEIVEPAYLCLKELATRIQYPALTALFQDPRIKWLFADGRAHILQSPTKFDIIEADALRPNSAYSGNLYSREYFQTLKSHLKPGGLAVTWAPTNRVLSSFLDIFPYVIEIDGILIGSDQQTVVDRETIERKLADPFVANYYQRIGASMTPLLRHLRQGAFREYSPDLERLARSDLNSDLFPRDEFMVPEP